MVGCGAGRISGGDACGKLGRQALSAYVLHLNYPSAYGIIGSFIAVMLWAYYAALVMLFGGEYVRVIGEERHGQRELPLKGRKLTRRGRTKIRRSEYRIWSEVAASLL